jgi:hypothetical protein
MRRRAACRKAGAFRAGLNNSIRGLQVLYTEEAAEPVGGVTTRTHARVSLCDLVTLLH